MEIKNQGRGPIAAARSPLDVGEQVYGDYRRAAHGYQRREAVMAAFAGSWPRE